jgi:hypothetical protein
MNKTKRINQLAIEAGKDAKRLKEQGLSLHEENYTEPMWLLSYEFDGIIRRLDEKHGVYFNKTKYENGSSAYERRLRKRLIECTLTYDGVRDFEAMVRRAFERTTREFYKRRTSYAKDEHSFEELTTPSNADEQETKKVVYVYSEKDLVEGQFEKSEIVRALFDKFGHCEKRRYIMSRFMDEKDLSISDLAREIAGAKEGTAVNSARVFVTRFIKDMRKFIDEYAA